MPHGMICSEISLANLPYRQNPAVTSQVDKVFVYVGQALETEMLHGQLGARVARAIQILLQSANVDPTPLLQQHFSPEGQAMIRRHFS